MKKILFVFAFLIILCSSLVFADTSATLTIRGYKSAKEDTLPTEGNLIVSVYDTRTSQTSTASVGDQVDITDDLENYKTAFKDIFAIKLQTNLKANVTVSIQFSPFINQKKKSDKISTNYKLTANGTDYTYLYNQKKSMWTTYYYSYFVKHSPSLAVGTTTLNTSSGYEVSASKTTTADIVQTIATYTATKRSYSDYPTISDVSDSDWYEYSDTSNSETLYKIEENAYVESMIYVQMKLDLDSNYEIATNVDYKAPVKITVSAQ